jgi:hypothetical protein
MPAKIKIESVNGDFGKVIEVKLVPIKLLELIKLKTGTKRRRNGLISYNVNLQGLRKMA